MTTSNVGDGVESYRTLIGPGDSEIVVERSRFLGTARPVKTLAEAESFVATVRRAHHDARHVCFGLRIGRGPQGLDRSNDDGEPSRTGGYPLWRLLDGEEITDALIVVVRYFGGIKLGTGGLGRAYGEAGRVAFDAAGWEVRWPTVTRPLPVDYPMLDRVQHLLASLEGVQVERIEYAEQPTLYLATRKVALEEVRQRLAAVLQMEPHSLLNESPPA